MLVALSITGCVGLIAGIVAAALADVFPRHRAALQDWGGGLAVGGVAVLGLAFPMI
jgi:hypothetical protein